MPSSTVSRPRSRTPPVSSGRRGSISASGLPEGHSGRAGDEVDAPPSDSTAVGLLRLRLDEKCSMTSQFDFFGAGVSAGDGEVPLAAETEGVLRPESSVLDGPADERREAQRLPRNTSLAPLLLLRLSLIFQSFRDEAPPSELNDRFIGADIAL